MNKTAIRNFAVWARNKLIADVSYHAGLMGITKNGIAQTLPQSTKDVEFFDIGTAEPYSVRGEAIQQRKSLVNAIRQKEKDSNYETAYSSLIEEVAYTWFNRLIAVRFMEVNDYLPAHIRVLSSESGKQEPDIVTNPFDAELFFEEDENQKIMQMKNDNSLDELFRILFIKQCHELSKILPRLFEGINDYTELLLNISYIDQDGVVFHLVNDLAEDDFNVEKGGQIEIIGWLYQYYNAERKDEVIKISKSSLDKEDIPAATQLFTTDWVVRYIVDNTLGRYWIEKNKNSILGEKLKYYFKTSYVDERNIDEKIVPEELSVFDPCMGSGHFLAYAFDVLMEIYKECGYSQRDAATLILKNNIYGLDIDDRASQLAYFAIMMKARQYNRQIFNEKVECNIFSILESNHFDRNCLTKLGDMRKIADTLLNDYIDAKEYGSIINLNVDLSELNALDEKIDEIEKSSNYEDLTDIYYVNYLVNELKPIVKQAKIMTREYHVVDTNPPYLNKYTPKLKKYLEKHYKDYSGDLFSVFIYKNLSFCVRDGYAGYMTPFVWMFIKQYESLRKYIVENKHIESLIQFEYSAFEEATVPICSFVIRNNKIGKKGMYIKLSDFKGGMDVQKEKVLEALKSEKCTYRYEKDDTKFSEMCGTPISFWLSENAIEKFTEGTALNDLAEIRQGLATSDNNRYLRVWFEPDISQIDFGALSTEDAKNRGKKWFPFNKGGAFRKWYGNQEYIVDYYDDGKDMKENVLKKYPYLSTPDFVVKNTSFYFKQSITWTEISSSYFGVRFCPPCSIFSNKSNSIFPKSEYELWYLLGFLCTKPADMYIKAINPTITTNVGDVAKIPVIINEVKFGDSAEIVRDNVRLEKEDWDSFETSWEFKKHPLV